MNLFEQEYNQKYIDFLNKCKTERESVEFFTEAAKEDGYQDIEDIIKSGESLKAGSKIFCCNKGKMLIMFHTGTESLSNGMNIVGAHIDSPRIDLKQNPLYEKEGLAFFDTHYYGGIKKYQWVTTPLALHGVVVKKDGSEIKLNIGENPHDPAFLVTDLLPHLAASQMKKDGSKVVTGENLDLLAGSQTIADDGDGEKGTETVKSNLLGLLKEKYDIDPDDFLSAEIEAVPAAMASDCGLDASMVMGYGQDDRVCAYAAFTAILEQVSPQKTCCCIFADKEEIGSVGASGMQSRYFEDMVAELVQLQGGDALDVRRALRNSNMLSADVSAAYDPLYAEVFDKNNAGIMGKGACFCKFTGARGKSGANDANAEYIAELRKILDDRDVSYQFAELGKVDEGGGGTIAYILANYGMNVIDCGVAILNMHSPCEVSSKADNYSTKQAYSVFLRCM